MTGEHKKCRARILQDNTPYVARSLLATGMLNESDMVPGELPKKTAWRDMKTRVQIKGDYEIIF